MENDIEDITNKIKSNDFDIITTEKKINKLEKKIVQLENKFTKPISEDISIDSIEESDYNVELNQIVCDIHNIEQKINDMFTSNENIENIIELYCEYKNKLKRIENKNDYFKLSVEYL